MWNCSIDLLLTSMYVRSYKRAIVEASYRYWTVFNITHVQCPNGLLWLNLLEIEPLKSKFQIIFYDVFSLYERMENGIPFFQYRYQAQITSSLNPFFQHRYRYTSSLKIKPIFFMLSKEDFICPTHNPFWGFLPLKQGIFCLKLAIPIVLLWDSFRMDVQDNDFYTAATAFNIKCIHHCIGSILLMLNLHVLKGLTFTYREQETALSTKRNKKANLEVGKGLWSLERGLLKVNGKRVASAK